MNVFLLFVIQQTNSMVHSLVPKLLSAFICPKISKGSKKFTKNMFCVGMLET